MAIVAAVVQLLFLFHLFRKQIASLFESSGAEKRCYCCETIADVPVFTVDNSLHKKWFTSLQPFSRRQQDSVSKVIRIRKAPAKIISFLITLMIRLRWCLKFSWQSKHFHLCTRDFCSRLPTPYFTHHVLPSIFHTCINWELMSYLLVVICMGLLP